MLNWFEKDAPIRAKFKALLAVQAALGAVGVADTYLAGGSPVLLVTAGCAFAATIGTLLIASARICTPYVNTVVRMEALAAGDISSRILYTDHKDCVGRMTKAMATFRENAQQLQNSSKTQQSQIVDALGSGL